jgi:hypothetical protein
LAGHIQKAARNRVITALGSFSYSPKDYFPPQKALTCDSIVGSKEGKKVLHKEKPEVRGQVEIVMY